MQVPKCGSGRRAVEVGLHGGGGGSNTLVACQQCVPDMVFHFFDVVVEIVDEADVLEL